VVAMGDRQATALDHSPLLLRRPPRRGLGGASLGGSNELIGSQGSNPMAAATIAAFVIQISVPLGRRHWSVASTRFLLFWAKFFMGSRPFELPVDQSHERFPH
jgi:hypothetical protein